MAVVRMMGGKVIHCHHYTEVQHYTKVQHYTQMRCSTTAQ